MPCHAAMNEKPAHIHEDKTVIEAVKALEKNKVNQLAVVDDHNVLQGVFSYQSLYKNLLPVSIPLTGGGLASMKINAPGVAKRLLKVEHLPVRDFMARKPAVVYPETPTWKGTHMMVETGGALYVVDAGSGKLRGLLDGASVMRELKRLSS